MTSNLPRLPIRFLTMHDEMRKSLLEEVDVRSGAAENVDRDNVLKGLGIAKSLEASSGGHEGGTDWKSEENAPTAPQGVVPQFRAPGDRNIGNVLFRRNPDSTLDLEAAKHVVVDMIHKVKDQLPLTELEKTTLGVFMPTIFEYVDPRLAQSLMAVHLRVTPWEIELVNHLVAAHLLAEMSYNAGLGGFPTEHRRA